MLFERLEIFSEVVVSLVVPALVQLVESSDLSTTYPLTGRPPSDKGALQDRETDPCPPTAVRLRGAEGLLAATAETE